MNFVRLNEIFCKQVVSDIGKLHKHQHIFLKEFQCSTSVFVDVFLQDYHM